MNHLRLLFTSFAFLIALSACEEDETAPECTTLATVRDLTGLGGCGWVLELENGERLEPYLVYGNYNDPLWCGPAYPDSRNQPYYDTQLWYDANPQDGMKVRIAYEVLPDQASVCMAGPIVQITCLEVVERPPSDQPTR